MPSPSSDAPPTFTVLWQDRTGCWASLGLWDDEWEAQEHADRLGPLPAGLCQRVVVQKLRTLQDRSA